MINIKYVHKSVLRMMTKSNDRIVTVRSDLTGNVSFMSFVFA